MKTITILGLFWFSFQAFGGNVEDRLSNVENKVNTLINLFEQQIQLISNNQNCHTSYMHTAFTCHQDMEAKKKECYSREFFTGPCFKDAEKEMKLCNFEAHKSFQLCTTNKRIILN